MSTTDKSYTITIPTAADTVAHEYLRTLNAQRITGGQTEFVNVEEMFEEIILVNLRNYVSQKERSRMEREMQAKLAQPAF